MLQIPLVPERLQQKSYHSKKNTRRKGQRLSILLLYINQKLFLTFLGCLKQSNFCQMALQSLIRDCSGRSLINREDYITLNSIKTCYKALFLPSHSATTNIYYHRLPILSAWPIKQRKQLSYTSFRECFKRLHAVFQQHSFIECRMSLASEEL